MTGLFLKSRVTKSLTKDPLPALIQLNLRLNGCGLLQYHLLLPPSPLGSRLGSGVTASIRRTGPIVIHAMLFLTNTDSPISQNRSILPSRQFILNDTSLAATYDAYGNRYLFFQDSTGHIRGALRTDNEWNTSLDLGINLNAKNHTPLAAPGSDFVNDFNVR